MDTIDFGKMNFTAFTNIMNKVKDIVNDAVRSCDDTSDVMTTIQKKVRDLQTVTFGEAGVNYFLFNTPVCDFKVVNNVGRGEIEVIPFIRFTTAVPKSGVVEYESSNYILFKIDCAVANDCVWDKIFKDELKGITALNIDNFKCQQPTN